jgi:hypothetical protein
MKKIIFLLLLVAALIIGLTACDWGGKIIEKLNGADDESETEIPSEEFPGWEEDDDVLIFMPEDPISLHQRLIKINKKV